MWPETGDLGPRKLEVLVLSVGHVAGKCVEAWAEALLLLGGVFPELGTAL